MPSADEVIDSIAGCLLGGAIGDALGGPHEGMSAPVFVNMDAPMQLSDDTQLTLATCEAIIETNRVDPATIAAQFVVWFRQRRLTGVGASTLKALQELAAGQHWALAGAKGDRAAGNGAAMRIAPLSFFCNPALEDDRILIRDVCRITHHNEEAYVAALAGLVAIRYAAYDSDSDMRRLPGIVAAQLPDSVTRDRLNEIAGGEPPTIPQIADRYGTTGYAGDTVPLAIVGAAQSGALDFEQILHDLIACGGDTDTIASIAGQIVGARHRFSKLPKHLVERVPRYASIVDLAESLGRMACNARS